MQFEELLLKINSLTIKPVFTREGNSIVFELEDSIFTTDSPVDIEKFFEDFAKEISQ
jgi:hypothetical protein